MLTALVCLAVAIPSFARADVVWPALFIEPRLLSVPVVVLGLLIESAVLRFGFSMSWTRASLLATVSNAASAALGAVLIPASGIAWEFFPGILLYKIFDLGTFNPLTWTATFVLAVVITSGIEVICLRLAFKTPWSQSRWWLWLAANAATVGLAFLSLVIQPPSDVQLYYPWLIR
ncbi:hypothetical protein [Ferrovibrio terrae]|uniref:hypothetical protein n=1 Tax=Ferrovibrio terrae TaxID=2594003 RepID=UPI003137FA90